MKSTGQKAFFTKDRANPFRLNIFGKLFYYRHYPRIFAVQIKKNTGAQRSYNLFSAISTLRCLNLSGRKIFP